MRKVKLCGTLSIIINFFQDVVLLGEYFATDSLKTSLAVKNFLEFAGSNQGQQFVQQADFIPLK